MLALTLVFSSCGGAPAVETPATSADSAWSVGSPAPDPTVAAPPADSRASPKPASSGQPQSRANEPADVAAAIAAAARAASAGSEATAAGSSPSESAASNRTTVQASLLAPASWLKIPKIGVDAPLVRLGVDGDGVMQVPNNGTDVGWYQFSALPGTAGNSVLSGHLDTPTAPAVFFRLNELKIGDPLSVLVGAKETHFEVFWTRSWPEDQAPLPLILGGAPSPTLTLITCSGQFDRTSKNYSGRLVVRAKLPGSV